MTESDKEKMQSKIEKGQYQLINTVTASGSHGAVFLAIDKETKEQVVIKITETNSSSQRSSIHREAEILLSFDEHPNFVQLKSHYQFSIHSPAKKKNRYSVLVMEKMHIDLMDYILSKDKLPENQAKILFHQICLGVQALHSNGIAHLDIKPDNILLRFKDDPDHNIVDVDQIGLKEYCTEEEKHKSDKTNEEILAVKLCDFGFAHFWKSENIPRHVGTKEYIPPEIRFHSLPYLPLGFLGDKSDIWSLGVTLFCMISGLFPFLSDEERIYGVNFGVISQNTKGNDCLDLLGKIFNPSPEDRPSIAQILAHPWLKDLGEESVTLVSKRNKSSPPPKRKSQSKFQKLRNAFSR